MVLELKKISRVFEKEREGKFVLLCEFMQRNLLLVVFLSSLAVAADSPTEFKYPPAPTTDQVDDYNGVKVADPYRPFENPDVPESRKWIEADSGTRRNQETPDRSLGLRAVRDAIQGKETLLFFEEHRPAKSERSLHDHEFFRAGPPAPRSKCSGQRRHHRLERH